MTKQRPSERIEAGIFDMDGVLLDSEPLHHQAVNAILAAEGRDQLSIEAYTPYMGTTDDYTWRDLMARFGLEKPFAFYREQYNLSILELYRTGSVIAPGARWLLGELRQRGLRLAVASSSRREWVDACLIALNLRDYFDELVTGDMVTRSKPDPEIYLLAAARLTISPQRSFAVEDSPKGIKAALAAGMFTIAVQTPYTIGQEVDGAQMHLRSLTEFDLALLDRDSMDYSGAQADEEE